MKTAEKVAEDVWCRLPDLKAHNAEDGIDLIAQALTDFAEERVKEALSIENTRIMKVWDVAKQARAEALEEAAKILENHGCTDCTDAIRALKKP